MAASRFAKLLPLLAAFGVVGLLLGESAPAHAQGGAGVVVDAEGVLRMRFAPDPNGQLLRQRQAQAKAQLAPEIARVSKLRKVSLNRLEQVLSEQIRNNQFATDDMKYLAGLTRISHVFYFPETNDIVIAGPAEGYMHDLTGRAIGVHSGRSVLELEDLVVALRAFPPSGRRAETIGCSIDPTAEGLARMQQFLANLRGITPNDAGRIAAGLKENLGLQTVTVQGISPKTHFAQVLVEADYRMKLIGIGLEKPPVNIPSYVSRANPRDVARNAMERWYFTPNYECVRVSDDGSAMQLVGDGVQLVGKNEVVDAQGGRAATNNVNRASQAFCTAFTTKYGELADREPVYAQLRNLIDMSIAAAFIQKYDLYAKADWHMTLFASEQNFPVETHHTPKQVETAVNVVWKGNTLMTPVGGGVHIQPLLALASSNLLSDEKGEIEAARKTITIKDLPADQWWWD